MVIVGPAIFVKSKPPATVVSVLPASEKLAAVIRPELSVTLKPVAVICAGMISERVTS